MRRHAKSSNSLPLSAAAAVPAGAAPTESIRQPGRGRARSVALRLAPAVAEQGVPAVVYHRLLATYGPQHWWPGEHKLEILVGAVLVQNTAWGNVERALASLKSAGYLASGSPYELRRLWALGPEGLAPLVVPAGTYRVKSRRLWELLNWIQRRHEGDLDRLRRVPVAELRAGLLSVVGIGAETADAICLYVAEQASFVVDAYARRVAARHGWGAGSDDAVRAAFVRNVRQEHELYNEYHALLVAVGKAHCRAVPRCEGCPLADFLPRCGVR